MSSKIRAVPSPPVKRGPQPVFEPAPDFEPHPSASGKLAFGTEAERLRSEIPGQWAKIALCSSTSSASSMATNIRRGRKAAFMPAGDWEAAASGTEVYARFVGRVVNRRAR